VTGKTQDQTEKTVNILVGKLCSMALFYALFQDAEAAALRFISDYEFPAAT